MDYQGFLTTVEQLGGISPDRAADITGDITCFTLKTLSQRVSKGELEDLAPRLPQELRPCLQREGPTATFGLDEFLRRIEERTGGGRATAERVARAVLSAVWTSVGPKEFFDMGSQLPKDFGPLLESAEVQAPPRPGPEVRSLAGRPWPLDEIVNRVAQRAGLDRDNACKALEAVLEELAVRVSAGQINDLRAFLPHELHPALDRGLARGEGRALPLTFDEFLNEITRLEGTSRHDALTHAKAVMAVLREVVGEKEFRDTTAQLPLEYRTLVTQP